MLQYLIISSAFNFSWHLIISSTFKYLLWHWAKSTFDIGTEKTCSLCGANPWNVFLKNNCIISNFLWKYPIFLKVYRDIFYLKCVPAQCDIWHWKLEEEMQFVWCKPLKRHQNNQLTTFKLENNCDDDNNNNNKNNHNNNNDASNEITKQ